MGAGDWDRKRSKAKSGGMVIGEDRGVCWQNGRACREMGAKQRKDQCKAKKGSRSTKRNMDGRELRRPWTQTKGWIGDEMDWQWNGLASSQQLRYLGKKSIRRQKNAHAKFNPNP